MNAFTYCQQYQPKQPPPLFSDKSPLHCHPFPLLPILVYPTCWNIGTEPRCFLFNKGNSELNFTFEVKIISCMYISSVHA